MPYFQSFDILAYNNDFAQCLTAETTVSPGDCSLKYQWYYNDENTTAGGVPIDGATGATYTITEDMIGKYIYVYVTAEKENYVTASVSVSAGMIPEKTIVAAPTVSGEYIFNGARQTVELNGFDENIMAVTGTTIASEVGTYTIRVRLLNTLLYTWTDGTTDSIELTWRIEEDVLKVGDYVNYPVEYDNVATRFTMETNYNEYNVNTNGWRVLSIDKTTGIVNLVSAGIPLNMYKTYDSDALTLATKMNSNEEFLNIDISSEFKDGYFYENGFKEYSSLKDAFTNKYTVINSDIPQVRAMTKDDVDSVYQVLGETTDETMENTYLKADIYKDMLAIPSTTPGYWAYYWLGTAYDQYQLWHIGGYKGNMESHRGGFSLGIRPVVTLKPEVVFTGRDASGAWNLYLPEANSFVKPTVASGAYVFTGSEHEVKLNYFDSEIMTITGDTKATDAGTYTIEITLNDTSKHAWADGTVEPVTLTWTIEEAKIGPSVRISGNMEWGSTLSADTAVSPADANVSYQWYWNDTASTENGTAIEGETGATYTVARDMVDKYIYVVVTVSKANYKTEVIADITDTPITMNHVYVTLYTDGTLGFSNDTSTIAGKTVAKSYGDISESHYTASGDVPWGLDVEAITTVDFVNEIEPYYSTAFWLFGCTNLSTINNISNLNTSNVTDMCSMFEACNSLLELNLSSFNTSNVTDMQLMFVDCWALEDLDVSNFDTKNVTSMYGMFARCYALESLELSNFDTGNVTNMVSMFLSCRLLTEIDVSSFDTRNVTDMAAMFANCYVLESLDVSNFDTSNVTNMQQMFYRCESITELDINNFNTSNVTNMSSMFNGSDNLTTIYVSLNWTTENADTTDMFLNCGTDHVCLIPTSVYVTLYEDGTLGFSHDETTIEGKTVAKRYGDVGDEHYTVGAYDSINNIHPCDVPWFEDRESITTVEFVNKVSPKYSTAAWFNTCLNLTEIINIENLYTCNVTDMSYMFNKCQNLENIDLSNFDTRNVTSVHAMLQACSEIKNLDLSNFDTYNVISMSHLVNGCTKLETINVSSFDTSSATDMYAMFANCDALVTLDISNFDTHNVTRMLQMFYGSVNLTTIYVGLDWTDENADTTDMFLNCGTDHVCLIPTSVYVTLYTDGTLAFSHNESTIVNKTVAKKYGDISEAQYKQVGYDDTNNMYLCDTPWFEDRLSITSVNFVNKVSPNSTAWWFNGCSNLVTINNIENLYTCNVKSINHMFANCSSLTNLDLSSFDTRNVTSMNGMVSYCSKLTSIDISNFDTSNLNNMGGMFNGCSALLSLDLSNFDTSKVTAMSGTFMDCTSLTSLDLSSFNTQSVTDMHVMFANCSNLEEIYVSMDWTDENADTAGMFTGCLAQSVTLKN